MRILRPSLVLLGILTISPASAAEKDHQRLLCQGMRLEVVLANGARADCLSATHAIEVEYSEHWAEGLGQALLYGAATDLKPGIFLVCRQSPANCLGHRLRLEEASCRWRCGRSSERELYLKSV